MRTEYRHLGGAVSLSRDLAEHLSAQHLEGLVVVVTDKPGALHAAVSKQWQRLIRQVQSEHSSTLDSSRIYALNRKIYRMQSVRMSSKVPSALNSGADILFMTTEQLDNNELLIQTMYITEASEHVLGQLSVTLGRDGLLVIFADS